MESIKIAYALSHLEKAILAIQKMAPECAIKLKEGLVLLEVEKKKYMPYKGHSLEYDYHNPTRS